MVNSVHLTLTNLDLITENLVTFDLMNEYGIMRNIYFIGMILLRCKIPPTPTVPSRDLIREDATRQ